MQPRKYKLVQTYTNVYDPAGLTHCKYKELNDDGRYECIGWAPGPKPKIKLTAKQEARKEYIAVWKEFHHGCYRNDRRLISLAFKHGLPPNTPIQEVLIRLGDLIEDYPGYLVDKSPDQQFFIESMGKHARNALSRHHQEVQYRPTKHFNPETEVTPLNF